MSKPSVTTACVTSRFAGRGERIVEFNANDGTGRGGLIALRLHDDGTFTVDLYRLDVGVVVRVGQAPDLATDDEG